MARNVSIALFVFTALALAGCGGSSSSGGAITGLTAPANVSIVTPDETTLPPSTSTGGAVSAPNMVAPGMFAPTSDFDTDEVDVWVYDPAMDGLAVINMILCMVGQTAADQLVNQGAYTAQIDADGCQAGQADGGGEGQSSAAGGLELELWTIESTRPSRVAPQEVRVWVPKDAPGDPDHIHAMMTLNEGATPENPFGSFSLDFVRAPDGGPFTNPVMFGNLSTVDTGSNSLGFSFFEEQGDVNVVPNVGDEFRSTQVTVEMSEDKTTGTARILERRRFDFGGGDSGIQTSEYAIAFDAGHLLRELVGNAPVCVSRTDFVSAAWRYNLYHAADTQTATAGDRVDLDSGFGFRTQGGDYGWIGYYGVWTPDGVTLNDGDTIERNNYSGQGSQELYTVLQSPGKLIRNSKVELPLVDIDANSRFEWWDSTMGMQFLVQYDGASWFRTDEWNSMTQMWDPLGGGPTLINTATEGFLGMWSQALGGSVFYKDGESFITYYTEEFVNSSDPVFLEAVSGELRLYGYYDALAAQIAQGDADTGNVYLAPAPNLAGAHPFVFDEATLTLFHDPNANGTPLDQVGLDTGVVPTQGPFMWGMRSGPMLTAAQHALLASVDDIWLASEFYVYETGHNSWNQYTVAVDSMGDAVAFDAPIQFSYTHSTANDMNMDATYDGQSFMMNYNGDGDFFGVPYEANGNGRYYPLFSISSGVMVGPTGNEYVLKAVEIEQALNVDAGQCGGLDLVPAQTMTLPDGSSFTVPTMGTTPVVTDPPAVVIGEVAGQTP